MLAGAVVVGVQAVHAVELLAVVLILLEVAVPYHRLQLHLLPDRTGDVRLGRVVHHAQLLARRTVDVLRDAAVGEVDLLGVAAQVVGIVIAYHLPNRMVDSEDKYRQFVRDCQIHEGDYLRLASAQRSSPSILFEVLRHLEYKIVLTIIIEQL